MKLSTRARDAITIINAFVFLILFVAVLPLGFYALFIVGLLIVITSSIFVYKVGVYTDKESRKLKSRIRYRVHHSSLEVKKYSIVRNFYFRKRHDLDSVMHIRKNKSYQRFLLVASVKEKAFTYIEETLYSVINLLKEPAFKGVIFTFESKVAEEEVITKDHPEILKHFDEGYVVMKPGEIKLYIKTEQYFHEMFNQMDIHEQITKLQNTAIKAIDIKERVEQLLIEEYRGGVT